MRLARPIADALRRGATIVAASSRATRALHLAWADLQRAEGRQVWPTPSIFDWDSWLRELWRDHSFVSTDAPVLLSSLQEQALWSRALGEDASGVVSPEAMAALAMEAWGLLSRHRAHATRRQPWSSPEDSTDAEHFRRWAAAFERECSRHHCISAAQLEERLAAAPGLSLPAELWLVGFDRIHPATRQLLDALVSRGTAVREFLPDSQDPARAWLRAMDARQEVAACASWARSLLLENPETRIGIIVPAVSDLRGEMSRVFRHTLMPQSEDIRFPAPPLPFEFSLGQPLAEVPAIRAALLLLRWIAAPLREEFISWLMLSGFVADTVTNSEALARHDSRQRSAGLLAPDRSIGQYRASLLQVAALRGLHERLDAVLHAAEANRLLDQQRRPSAWTEMVHHLLDRAGWPGLRPPDSIQFQAQQRWERLLDEIAALDFDGSVCSFESFLAVLERHSRETIFAPESQDAPIQIMGPAESSGQQFDAVWFTGTDDTRWPARGRLHPLLPAAVQREFAMPHATPEDDWNLAHAITMRLLGSTQQIVFSCAQREKDAELRPSPLIAGLFPDIQPQPAAEWLSLAESTREPRLDIVPDDSGVLPWPSERIAGGADVLRRQAACPFQSFATKRLAAQPLEESEWGLSALDRGNLLHRVMQRLFTASEPAIRTRDDIVTAIRTNNIGALLDEHIEAALRETLPEQPADSWTQSYLAAERRRLRTRIEEWLACEAARHPFTVEGCEQKLPDVRIGELRMNLRADRIDLLPDGSRLLLDYKTGDVSTAAWQGERPEEPQLPLYAAFGNVENLSGVLFAQIRAGDIGFKGRVRDAKAQLMPEVKAATGLVRDPYSDEMRSEWARILENLADEFLRGEAAVEPREAKVCERCELHGLCRVAEVHPSVSNGEEAHDA
jgi:ATP-dependent helicase/nuclease subunit B